MSPTNPQLPCACCRHHQCKASQPQCRFWWLCLSFESSAQVQVQLRVTQVWVPCCQTIWQHRYCDSPPLLHTPFSSSSSHLQGYRWAVAPAWLFPCNEFPDRGDSLIMEHGWISCPDKFCSSDLLEVWKQASSQHHLTIQVKIWLIFCWHCLSRHRSHTSCQRFQFSPTLWIPIGLAWLHILLDAAEFPIERNHHPLHRVELFWYHL